MDLGVAKDAVPFMKYQIVGVGVAKDAIPFMQDQILDLGVAKDAGFSLGIARDMTLIANDHKGCGTFSRHGIAICLASSLDTIEVLKLKAKALFFPVCTSSMAKKGHRRTDRTSEIEG